MFFCIFRSRFQPPADLFPVGYRGPAGHVGPVGPAGAAAFPGLFDYDDLSLGPDFDLATAESGIAVARAGAVAGAGAGAGGHYHPAPPPARKAAYPAPRHPSRHRGVGGVGVVGVPVGTAVAHSPSRRLSLWRKLYYLDYLRRVYAK